MKRRARARAPQHLFAARTTSDPVVFRVARVCSRLSFNPAQDASNWRWPRGVHGEEVGLPRCLDDADAGTTLENPDIRVPSGTKREDGQQGAVEEKDAEEPGREENGGNTEDQEKKADDDQRNGNSVVPREAAD
ncbi:hypothetical protein NDU88_005499 [Pleurodeles waltl]|uniref:Prothymosin alpha n=1 Tax=Pleurodeles waltl TaxID=8319 RepID=A0AAV7TAU2_PLEWA|nr:hypothetical protein NDU88_005499 [Pleurodeles waltl]